MALLENNIADNSGIEFRDLARMLFKRLWVVPLVSLVCLGVGLAMLTYLTPIYESEIRMVVMGRSKIESPFYDAIQVPITEPSITLAETLKSMDLTRQVVKTLNLDQRDETVFYSGVKVKVLHVLDGLLSGYKRVRRVIEVQWLGWSEKISVPADPTMAAVEKLQKRLVIEPIEKADVVRVLIQDYDPQMAARIGNTLARAYSVMALSQHAAEIQQKYGSSHPLALQLQDQLRAARADLQNPDPQGKTGMGYGNVKVVGHAYPATKSKKPSRRIILLASVVGGILGGVFLLILLENMDPMFRHPDEISRGLEVPLLGVIPKSVYSRSFFAKGNAKKKLDLTSFYPIAHQIQILRRKQPFKTLCLSGLEHNASNVQLAEALAFCLSRLNIQSDPSKSGHVLLVEAGRQGSRSLPFLMEKSRTAKTRSTDADSAATDATYQAIDSHLSLAGMEWPRSTDPEFMVQQELCQSTIAAASQQFDLVVVHGPDYAKAGEFVAVNSACEATILLVSERDTRRKVLDHALQKIAMSQTNLIGVVVNNRTHSIPGFLYDLV